jgi:hypothetical protein
MQSIELPESGQDEKDPEHEDDEMPDQITASEKRTVHLDRV